MRALPFLLLVACGGVSDDGSAGGSGDGASPQVDAERAADSPGGGGSSLTPTTLTCITRTRALTNTDGSKIESRSHFALVDGITRDTDFAVEVCDMRSIVNGVDQTDACPAPFTCADSGAPAPMAPLCNWTRRSGTFTADGKLEIFCGSGNTFYNASGVATGTSDSQYTVVRIYK